MVKLLLINAFSKNKTNEIGDVVKYKFDKHIYSPAEKAAHDIKTVQGTVNDYNIERDFAKVLFSRDINGDVQYPRKYILSLKDDKAGNPADIVEIKTDAVAVI